MKVGTRLSLFCSVVFGVIFLIISLLIYGLYYNSTEDAIYKGLKQNAYITAFFYLEEDELNAKEFENIRTQFEELVPRSSFQIYNEQNKVSYGQENIQIKAKTLDDIRAKHTLAFRSNDYLCYGVFYEDNQGDFVVITIEHEDVLSEQMNPLFTVLVISLLIGLLAIVLLSRWVAQVAYRPFTRVINQVNSISTNNLEVQIDSPNTKDELQDLIDTFNNLLAKISETFVIQKNFVNYVSHEFKTPLTSVMGNLEVFSIKDRNPEEYQELSEKVIKDIYQLEEILDTLMIVSDLREDVDTDITIRLDELVWEVVQKVKGRYSIAKIEVDINIPPQNEGLLQIKENRTQLFMALLNLIDNAVKYSKGKIVNIRIYEEHNILKLSIEDQGIGIPACQLSEINKPFYRAQNVNEVQGLGIGLSIALRILEKCNIQYQIESREGTGTTVVLAF